MKKILVFYVILMVFLPLTIAQECDYSIKLVIAQEFSRQNFSFKIVSMNIRGPAANISSEVIILNDGEPIKSYFPWKNAQITKQKTSSKYTPNLEIGEYNIKANLQTMCKDSDLSNNFDSVDFAIISDDNKISANEDNNYDNFIYSREIYYEERLEADEYLSSNEKSKKIAFYALIGISIIIAIVIIKRD